MKKLLTVGSALMLLSTSAFATQSRLLALGMNETDNEGMYYVQDGRNIFLNSANVNLLSDQLVTEWGTNGSTVGQGQTIDASHTPKAQGGVFKKIGSMTYGVYYGNESNTSSLLRVAGSRAAGPAVPTADNQLDLFVGGDAGLKWGANVTYAHSKDDVGAGTIVNSKTDAISTRFGLIGSNWDAHANISLKSDGKASTATVTQEFDGKLGLHIGGSFLLTPESKVFGYVKHYGWDQKLTGTTDVKGDFTSYYLGYGREMAVNETGKVFMGLTAKKTDINLKYAQKGEVRHLVVPLNIGYEAVATEWLTLRGSVVQNLWSKRDNKRVSTATGTDLSAVASGLIGGIYGGTGKATLPNSTEVNAGASLIFGQLTLDGMIGLTSSDRGAGATGGSGATAAVANKNQGLLALDNLGSRIGLTYKF